MSEYPALNLILGIVGTVTGIIALLISYWTYRKEKPSLKIQIIESTYNFTNNPSEKKHINLWVKFQAKNLGDRGTRINDVALEFKIDSNYYRLKKTAIRIPFSSSQSKAVQNIWLEAHDSVTFSVWFNDEYESKEKDKIDSIFTIFHTHGSEVIKFTSEMKEIPTI